METQETRFKRYLLSEFLWELEQHPPAPSIFAGIKENAVEVLTFRGYHDMRVRVAGVVFDVHLSWRKDVSPEIREVESGAV